MNTEGDNSTVTGSKHMQNKSSKQRHCIISIILLVLSVQSWFLQIVTNHFINPNEYSSNKWIEVKYWNLTNPENVLNGTLPKFSLTKPIVYDIMEIEYNITSQNNGEYISYNYKDYYLFNAQKSQLSPTEHLNIISPIVSTIWQQYKNADIAKKEELKEIMKELPAETLFWKGTASDLLFNTYHIDVGGISFNWGILNNGSGSILPSISLNTGKFQQQLTGQVNSFYNETFIGCWNPASSIYPGYYQYGPYGQNFITTYNPIYSFIPDLFRTIELNYNRTVMYKNTNVWQYLFNINPQLLNASQYPPNAQFFQYGPSGIFNLTNCYDGISWYVGLPLFYGATDYAANNTKIGMSTPNIMNQPYILIQNQTGNVYFANISLQYNTLIHSIPNNEFALKNIIDDVMVPMFQMSQIEEIITNGAVISYISQTNLIFTSRLLAYFAIPSAIMHQIWIMIK